MTGIAYCTDGVGNRGSGVSFNENLNVSEDGYTLALEPLGMSSHFVADQGDRLSEQGAAEYYWALLIEPLQR